jgi:sugar phosphate isomerase/epimerase
VYLACSSQCFAHYPLDKALKTIQELQFAKVDLVLDANTGHLSFADIVADVNRCAQILRTSNMAFASFHLKISPLDAETDRELLRAVCRLGRMLTVPLLTIPAAPLGSDLDAEVQRLTHLTRLAEAEGMILAVETHSQTVTADPETAAALCHRVPGLGLTLDPTHYLIGPHRTDCYEDLCSKVRHVRLRDSRGDQFQVRVGQGEIEYGKIINQLARHGYDRALSVDVHDLSNGTDGNEPEVRKLKYLLDSMI